MGANDFSFQRDPPFKARHTHGCNRFFADLDRSIRAILEKKKRHSKFLANDLNVMKKPF